MAHKAILAARSQFFEAMLQHDTKEAQESMIEIPDVKLEVCESFLRYLYTGKFWPDTEEYAEELLILADKVWFKFENFYIFKFKRTV